MRMQSNGHTSTHQMQPVQFSSSTNALGISLCLMFLMMSPVSSWMAKAGQYLPHTPQSMQSVGSIYISRAARP